MARTKLNPGADATLVSAAYRAAAGNVPGDYSKALESATRGYEKTMEARSEMWGNIAKLGSNIGVEMMANADELTSYAAKLGGLDAEGAAFLENELYANKDAQKELGLFGGRFGDRETRKKRAELKLKQSDLFAEIDLAVESINTGADAIANGLYDAELANLNKGDAEKVNAIIKSNLKDKNTENRNYAKLGRHPDTGELMYTLYDSDTNEPTMLNGKPQTMTIKEFNRSITNNVKDTKNVIGTNLGTIENDVATLAQKSKTGVIDEQTKQLALNRLDGVLQTDTDLKRAMLAKYGYSNTSFIDDLNTKGAVSANLYGGMLRALGLGEGSQVPAEGAFEGIKDTDGVKGLSLNEVNAAYNIYVDNIIGMKDPEASKAAFKASFADRMDGAHTYGYGKRPTQKPWEAMGLTALQFAKLNQGEEIKFDKTMFVPNVIDPGGDREIQVSASSRANAYRNLQNKSRGFQGANGYYGITKDGKYIRYDSKQQYDKAHKGKLKHHQNEDIWEDMFDTSFGTDRYIDATRVAELEGAYSNVIQSNRPSDYYKNLIKK